MAFVVVWWSWAALFCPFLLPLFSLHSCCFVSSLLPWESGPSLSLHDIKQGKQGCLDWATLDILLPGIHTYPDPATFWWAFVLVRHAARPSVPLGIKW